MAPLYQAHNTVSERGTDILHLVRRLRERAPGDLYSLRREYGEVTEQRGCRAHAPPPQPQHLNVDAVVVQYHRALNDAGK